MPLPYKKYPPSLSEFHTDLEFICLDSCSLLKIYGVNSIESYNNIKKKEYAVNKFFRVNICLAHR